MIKSYSDYISYLQADKAALGVKSFLPILFTNNSMVWLTDPIYRWQRLLRKLEFFENCKRGSVYTFYKKYLRWRFVKKSVSLGFSIPINTCGPGLCILHYGSIVISRHACLGSNCTVNSCVNIGAHKGGAPNIGNSVYIGPGAKLFGPIEIADGVQIGANAVVSKSCTEIGAKLVGVPASPLYR